MQIGQFLLRRLREAGIKHLFGVPGDYNLEFMQQLEEAGAPAWIGNCNELNAAYAADGYARINGLAAVVVTHGVGALSAINGIAGAYSEHVPVICICGSPPLKARDRGLRMHHTFANNDLNNFYRIFAEVTVAQAQLRPDNAAAEIDRLLLAAWRHKSPVYLELPSDLACFKIVEPSTPLAFTPAISDPERLSACVDAIAGRLRAARSPAILLDLDAQRFDVLAEVAQLAERLDLPVATINTCKGALDETSPCFIGVYAGGGSAPETRRAVEESDCLLAVGVRRVDSTSGFFTDRLPGTAIHLRAFSADVGEVNYQAVALKDVWRQLAEQISPRQVPGVFIPPLKRHEATASTGKLTQAAFWQAAQGFLRQDDVLIAEDGTSSAGAGELSLPPRCTFITQAIWGSIGYSLGCLLGTLMAAPDRRQMLFIGDGSFQLTAQELSSLLRHDLKPWIFLLNNGGYTIERTILGRHSRYNDVANWRYADLPRVFCRESKAASFVVATVEELQAVLAQTHDCLVFVEVILDTDDSPASLVKGGHASADLDYGPCGPQHAPDAQIPLQS